MRGDAEPSCPEISSMTQIVRDPTTGLDRLVLARLPTPLDARADARRRPRLGAAFHQTRGHVGLRARRKQTSSARFHSCRGDRGRSRHLGDDGGKPVQLLPLARRRGRKARPRLSSASAIRDRNSFRRQSPARRHPRSDRDVYERDRSLGSRRRAGAAAIAADTKRKAASPTWCN